MVFAYTSGLQTLFTRGHISSYTIFRGPDILADAIVSGYVTFYQSNKFLLKNVIFSLLTKCVRGPDEMPSRDGFGPRAVFSRPQA